LGIIQGSQLRFKIFWHLLEDASLEFLVSFCKFVNEKAVA
jgi:hypothetical protein